MSFRAVIKSMIFYATGDSDGRKQLKVFLKLKIPDKSSDIWKNSIFPLKPEEDHGFFSGPFGLN